jgi:peroxiredoxin
MRQRVAIAGLLVCSMLVALLAYQNHSLRGLVVRLAKDGVYPRAGIPLPPLAASTLSGDSVVLGLPAAGATQLLFAFNTSCPYCRASLPAWNSITRTVAKLRAGAIEVYGVSVDSLAATRRYAAEHHLPYPVALVSGSWPEIYRLTVVPSVIVLDSTGRTIFARVGVLKDSSLAADSVIRAVTGSLTHRAAGQQVAARSTAGE